MRYQAIGKRMTTKRKKEWFDDDSFWEELYPFIFSAKRFKVAAEQIGKILALTQPEGRSVLDLCCGPGRCSVMLAEEGFSVTGVDRTKILLDKARARAKAAGVIVNWVEQDARDFVRPSAFDLALSMFTSFGYFDNKLDDITVLANVLASLRPGGIFLLDMMGKERLAHKLQRTTSETLPDGSMLVQRNEVFDDWTRIRKEWILVRQGHAKRFTFHHNVYSGQEIRDRMEQVGFVDVSLYGNLDGDEYDQDAKRLIAVGHKSLSANSRTTGGSKDD